MSLMKLQEHLLNFASAAYLVVTLFYIIYTARRAEILGKAATVLGLAGVVAHTLALVFRWIVAGWDHPPFTNLYESLVFFGWGIVVFYLYMEWRYKVRIAGAFVFPVALAAMFIAETNPEKGLVPLPDALKSWWLHAHVMFASIAYAAFVVAFAFSLMFLIKDKVRREYFGAIVAFLLSATFFFTLYIRGGGNLGIFAMKQMAMHGGELVPVAVEGTNGREYAMQMIPGAGPLILAAAGLFLLSTIFYVVKILNENPLFDQAAGASIATATALLTIGILVIVQKATSMENVSIRGEPFLMALIFLMWLLAVGMTMLHYLNAEIVERLPEADKLDFLGYRSVVVAFPLMTIVIVTGAVWAQSAWGRYWGWDPKETASLVTWFVYAIYLHARIVAGWKERPSAIISIFGFLSVIFTYLGVNVFLSGLHSYASSL